MTIYLYSCTACGASAPDARDSMGPTTYACEVQQSDPFYCPKCRPGLIPAAEHAQIGEAVSLVDANPLTRWVVLNRADDLVTVRPLGLPGFRSRVVCIAEIRPQFSYERLNSARRKPATASRS